MFHFLAELTYGAQESHEIQCQNLGSKLSLVADDIFSFPSNEAL